MYIFDLEGTITNFKHREEYYEERDWDKWNEFFIFDTPRKEIIRLLNVCSNSNFNYIKIVTAKNIKYKNLVDWWLSKYNLNYLAELIIYKENENGISSPLYKFNQIQSLIANGDIVDMVFDDRADVVDFLLNKSIPAIKV